MTIHATPARPVAELILDTHVHAYRRGGHPERMLRALLRHAGCANTPAPTAAQPVRAGMVIVTRSGGQDLDLAAFGTALSERGWKVRTASVPHGVSYLDVIPAGQTAVCARCYAGRQIVCAERLETLALGCDPDIPDGVPLDETLERIRRAGAVAVLPWGLGKWWGTRGKIIRHRVAEAAPGAFCLGDVALRPRGWPTPAPMRMARQRGRHVLAGSDPFDRPADADRVGAYAARIGLDHDEFPAPADLCARLSDPHTPITATGRRDPVFNTVRRQLHTQFRKEIK